MAAEGPLDELAANFMTPAKSGVYLTKNELVLLARAADASLRVNERRRMLADILKSAQSTEELALLVERLRGFCEMSLASYEDLVATAPVCAKPLAPWIEKTKKTIGRLDALAAEIRL